MQATLSFHPSCNLDQPLTWLTLHGNYKNMCFYLLNPSQNKASSLGMLHAWCCIQGELLEIVNKR
jgi:hypothetical protein